MGSTAKTSQHNSSTANDVTIENEVKTTDPKRKNTKNNGFLEAFDTPVPLVIPSFETRTLKVRNCGSDDVEMKINIQNVEGNDDADAFEIHETEATVKPNEVFLIRVTYNAVEEKFDPDADNQPKRTRSKSAKKTVNKQNKKFAILEITVGEKDFLYMYPLLGSDDPKDEAVAMQKHINLSKTDETDEEDLQEMKDSAKNKRKMKELPSSVIAKRHKLDKEVTIVLTRTTFPCPSRSIPNAVIKEESEENIEIKDEPLH